MCYMPNYAESLPKIHALAPEHYGAVVNERMPTSIIVDISSPTGGIRYRYPHASDRDLLEFYYQAVAHFNEWNTFSPNRAPILDESRILDLGVHGMTDSERSALYNAYCDLYSEVRSIFINMGLNDLIAADGAFSYMVRTLTNNGNVMILDYLST